MKRSACHCSRYMIRVAPLSKYITSLGSKSLVSLALFSIGLVKKMAETNRMMTEHVKKSCKADM